MALCVHVDVEQQLSSPGHAASTTAVGMGGYSLPTSDPLDPNSEDVVLFGSSVNEPIDSKSVSTSTSAASAGYLSLYTFITVCMYMYMY